MGKATENKSNDYDLNSDGIIQRILIDNIDLVTKDEKSFETQVLRRQTDLLFAKYIQLDEPNEA